MNDFSENQSLTYFFNIFLPKFRFLVQAFGSDSFRGGRTSSLHHNIYSVPTTLKRYNIISRLFGSNEATKEKFYSVKTV